MFGSQFPGYPPVSYHFGGLYDMPYTINWGLPELAPVYSPLSPQYQVSPPALHFNLPPANAWDTAGWSAHVTTRVPQFTMQYHDGQYSGVTGMLRNCLLHVTHRVTR
jgi:hypothetical protein